MEGMDSVVWPLAGLQVVTPRLTLRYVTDEFAVKLATLAANGIHDPATMPFSEPWTDVPSPELERNCLRYYWRNRAEASVDNWNLRPGRGGRRGGGRQLRDPRCGLSAAAQPDDRVMAGPGLSGCGPG